MAWEFLRPILTPNALATVQANPVLLAYLLGWIGALLVLIAVIVTINIQTSKAYKKPKKAADGKKGGAPAKSAGIKGVLSSVRAKLRM
jgi:hypothetical protein